jgi:hypothetical protein
MHKLLELLEPSRRALALSLAATVAVLAVGGAAAASPVTFTTPGAPAHLLIAYGSVWVAGHYGDVYRLNPRTNRRVATIAVPSPLCLQPAAGAGSLWISGCTGLTGVDKSYRIDPGTRRVVGTVNGGAPFFGAGSLWTTTSTSATPSVLRLDPRTGLTLTTIPIKIDVSPGGGLIPFAIIDGSLWAMTDTAVARIDTATNQLSAIIALPGAKVGGAYPGGYLGGAAGAYADGKVWVPNPAGLFEIDPSTNTAQLVPVRFRPMSNGGDINVGAANGSLWFRTGNKTVARFDPTADRLLGTSPAAGGGGGIAVGFGSLWVANAGADSVWRERIH